MLTWCCGSSRDAANGEQWAEGELMLAFGHANIPEAELFWALISCRWVQCITFLKCSVLFEALNIPLWSKPCKWCLDWTQFLPFFCLSPRPPFCLHYVVRASPLHKSRHCRRCLVLNSLEKTFHSRRSIASPVGRGGGDINYRSDQVDKVASIWKWHLAPLSLCTGNKQLAIKARGALDLTNVMHDRSVQL